MKVELPAAKAPATVAATPVTKASPAPTEQLQKNPIGTLSPAKPETSPPLAHAVLASREAIWSILADPDKFATL